jgi:protein arginine N-methyltransferase 5
VSIWRLTNRRQVWYEWYAESFFWVQHPPPPVDSSTPLSPAASFLGSPRPYPSIPSPLVDAVDTFAFPEKKEKAPAAEVEVPEGIGMVKIGQTSLHNPSGRSSWIGL